MGRPALYQFLQSEQAGVAVTCILVMSWGGLLCTCSIPVSPVRVGRGSSHLYLSHVMGRPALYQFLQSEQAGVAVTCILVMSWGGLLCTCSVPFSPVRVGRGSSHLYLSHVMGRPALYLLCTCSVPFSPVRVGRCSSHLYLSHVMGRPDINENGITLVTRESYFKKNYLFNVTSEEKRNYKALLTETVLVNLRTYDQHSLILHANDHLNNFLQLYITAGTKVVLLFNRMEVIHNITVEYGGLNSGKSVQIAVERRAEETILHVNDHNSSVPVGVRLLTEYSNKPWNNSEKGMVS
ncbi:hypothetical protein J6590_049692 [Homalodisca vitripennis]|nr:hypothetical protein J6590_053054 [Homalodisca vitripennis]KAG8270317.1 hypothetical protein J6590_087966 [Homalodisca vitripennis]KAG8306324.1 hypothetical protein J6590_049692 [Homalodisca vitripennis]